MNLVQRFTKIAPNIRGDDVESIQNVVLAVRVFRMGAHGRSGLRIYQLGGKCEFLAGTSNAPCDQPANILALTNLASHCWRDTFCAGFAHEREYGAESNLTLGDTLARRVLLQADERTPCAGPSSKRGSPVLILEESATRTESRASERKRGSAVQKPEAQAAQQRSHLRPQPRTQVVKRLRRGRERIAADGMERLPG